MAGTINLSFSQIFDSQARPLAGGFVHFIVAGTTSTPQTPYQDAALSIAHPNPIELDAAGFCPQFYLADGQIKIRITTAAGVLVRAADNLLVIGPSSGVGSPPSVDATTVLATGDVKCKYGTGTLTGFVRLNGRTIGSATSGASERANADTQALFEYLWTADPNLAVSGGRGASANADWSANKTIALPDWRGRVPAGLDDMGAAAAGRLTSSFFGASGTVLGNAGGGESKSLVTGNLPPYTPAGSVSSPVTDPGHGHPYRTSFGGGDDASGGLCTDAQNQSNRSAFNGTPDSSADHLIGGNTTGITVNSTFTGTAQGGTSAAFNVTQPTILVTYYIKL